MLRVRVLGELELELDGAPVGLPSRRPARALLGWLALHPGMHARSTVAGRLWPNVLDQSARVSLRSSLSALRTAIGPGAERALVTSRDQLGLAASSEVWVDIREFEHLLEHDRARDALELCRGELLSEFDEDWVLVARDEHRARQGKALGALAAAAAASGEQEAAIALARRRAALDPFDELAQRELIGVVAAAGDRGGALIMYERLAERLRRELGVAPSQATRSLVAELRRGGSAAEPALGDARADSPTAGQLPLPTWIVAARRRGPLLGRAAELARLHELWKRSDDQARQLALVTGEPGIGKTRLVSEFAAELHSEGVLVLYGRTQEEALVPYEPLVDCLREPLHQPVVPASNTTELASLLPALASEADAPSPAGGVGDPSPSARQRLFDAIGAALDAIAPTRPALLILEDLHWAELATVRLLVHLASRPTGVPRLLVVTYRDTDVGELDPFAAGLAGLHRSLPVEHIALHGIGRDAVAAMLEQSPSPDRAPDADALREHTGGNPFFIEQLLKDDGPLAADHGDRTPATGVRHVVARRVNDLGPEARHVLDAAAVTGAEFELALLAEVAGRPVDATLDVLDTAVRARLIAELPGEPGRYTFVHAIVRDTLAGSLTETRRNRLHELIADRLEGRAAADPDRYIVALASHALEAASGAGDPERAADVAARAADLAGAVLAFEDAAGLLRRALSVLERRGGSTARRAELLCSLVEVLERAGSQAEARTALAEARKLARAADRSDLLARAALAAGGTGVTILGTDSELVAELEHALDAIGGSDPVLRVRLLARLAIELAYDQDPTRRESVSSEALRSARHLDDPAALAAALNARHVALWGPDHSWQRLRVATEMLELAERAENRSLALQARNWRVVDLFELADGQAVQDELDAYAALSAQAGLPAYAWYMPMWRATRALLEGRIADGLTLSKRARDLGRKAGDRNADVFFQEQQLVRHMVQGRIRDLSPPDEGTLAERSRSAPVWRAYRFTFAWLHAERGELEQARDDFELAYADGFTSLPRDVNWLDAVGVATNACVMLADVDRARELGALLKPYADRVVVNARGALHAGSVAYLLARLAATCGDHPSAAELYELAAERDARANAPAWVLRDLRHHSDFLRAIGQHERADDVAGRAWQQAKAIGLDRGVRPASG